MANNSMSTDAVRAEINKIETDNYQTQPSTKSIKKGWKLGENGAAGSKVISELKPPNKGKSK